MDQGHIETEKLLVTIERKIKKIYEEASKDLQKQADEYFAKFAKRDKEQRELLKAGKITEERYRQWRLAQMGRGKWFEAMRDSCATRVTHANEVATAYVNDDMAKVYALNRQFTIGDVQKQAGDVLSGIDFIQYDEKTVKRLLVEEPDLMPHYPEERALDRGIDLKWGKKQITDSITSGIIRGSSIDQISKDMTERISNMGRTSAIRAARTAYTAAENAGRQDGAEDLEQKGVILKKIWVAMIDSRVRHVHAEANGQEVDNGEPFVVGGEEMMFPCDASMGASPWNLYNCRCTRETKVVGFKSTLTDKQRKKANIRVVKW